MPWKVWFSVDQQMSFEISSTLWIHCGYQISRKQAGFSLPKKKPADSRCIFGRRLATTRNASAVRRLAWKPINLTTIRRPKDSLWNLIQLCMTIHLRSGVAEGYTVNPLLSPPSLISPPFQRRKVNKLPLSVIKKDENTSLFFLGQFNVDNRFIVVFSLDMDWFQLYLLS